MVSIGQKLTDENSRGFGLGLTICSIISKIISNNNQIEIESQKDFGTTISFYVDNIINKKILISDINVLGKDIYSKLELPIEEEE